MPKRLLACILFLLLFSSHSYGQVIELNPSKLAAGYDAYKEKSIEDRRFKHKDVIHLVKDRSSIFEIKEIGKSVEGKEIYQMTTGAGPTNVLLWSQMHGNESTATMALFDLFNFLEAEGDEFDELRKLLHDKLTIRFIPMLNPDGMDRWMRRNALDIDMNRDALHLTSPESQILKNARDEFSPEFGFNLHDQQIYYTVGQTEKPATISVLAPAYNYETEVNAVRKRAMQVIVGINELMEELEPGHVGKYDDAFEPRAFGDNIQKWGTSTILIESGGYPNDPEKQHIRKLNFLLLVKALAQIADESYTEYALEDYYAIPDNSTLLMDLIIRNISMEIEGYSYTIDLGIRRRESESDSGYYVNGSVADLGDLSIFYGYEEIDAKGMEVVAGKIYEEEFSAISQVTGSKAMELLKEGYLAILVKNEDGKELHDLPLLVLTDKDQKELATGIRTGGNPNFFLAKEGTLTYAIVNGYAIDLRENQVEGRLKMRIEKRR